MNLVLTYVIMNTRAQAVLNLAVSRRKQVCAIIVNGMITNSAQNLFTIYELEISNQDVIIRFIHIYKSVRSNKDKL